MPNRGHPSQFSDVEWRFLETSKPKASRDTQFILPPSFLDQFQQQHTFDNEYVNPKENKVLSLLTGESQRDDMLDSLMNELNTIRSQLEKQPKNEAHDMTIEPTPLPSPNKVARRMSIFRPGDVQLVKETAKARIHGQIDKLQEEVLHGDKKNEISNVETTRPTTPNITFLVSERVSLARDIPEELLDPLVVVPNTRHTIVASPIQRQSKKPGYGAWYLPPKSWCKQTADGARCRVNGAGGTLGENAKAQALRDTIPKLFIAREYRNFITTTKNQRIPAYLKDSSEVN
ncbi:hypothetical protein THRCLA_20653 [Thraustotheca clavata]|uniref:Uncharacterized protein n=1 Tax=Thraustotheca clavata TaxID=74557 RepID=A0A1W0A4W7_9STRA|nr:hypothetical protein THRCLA_20653 [Thraustotheca clavata]